MEQTEIRPGVILTHHEKGKCLGTVCSIHNPSDHAFRSFPLGWDADRGVMTRDFLGTIVPDPDDYKIRSGQPVIWRNSAKCRDCGTLVESTHRWDYVTCACGSIAVDGGYSYLRRIGSASDFEDTSVIINPPKE